MRKLLTALIIVILTNTGFGQSSDYIHDKYDQGVIAYEEGKFNLSIKLMDEVNNLDSTYIGAYKYRADANYRLRNYTKAITDYSKAIWIFQNPPAEKQDHQVASDYDAAYLYHNKGIAQYYLQQYEAALSSFGEALDLNPGQEESRVAMRKIQDVFAKKYAPSYNRNLAFQYNPQTSPSQSQRSNNSIVQDLSPNSSAGNLSQTPLGGGANSLVPISEESEYQGDSFNSRRQGYTRKYTSDHGRYTIEHKVGYNEENNQASRPLGFSQPTNSLALEAPAPQEATEASPEPTKDNTSSPIIEDESTSSVEEPKRRSLFSIFQGNKAERQEKRRARKEKKQEEREENASEQNRLNLKLPSASLPFQRTRNYTINSPSDSDNQLKLETISVERDKTILTIEYKNQEQVAQYIKVNKPGDRGAMEIKNNVPDGEIYKLIGVKNIVYPPQAIEVLPGQSIRFELHFEPLDKKTQNIDIYEGDNKTNAASWNFLNIGLDG